MYNWDIQGELNEHEKIVSVLREVDIVISALAYPQVPDQLEIIDAIKVAGNIKVHILCWELELGSFGDGYANNFFIIIGNKDIHFMIIGLHH